MKRLTLTEALLGVHKHGLVSKLTEESFAFLIGIILAHNDTGFADDFDMTNAQAMAAGGGNTPKSVRRRRTALNKFRINGKPLLKFKSGNRGRNTCAAYELNYNSLCSYNGVWSGEKDLPAHLWASSGEGAGSVEGTVEGTVEAPSLDQIRSEEIRSDPPTPLNDVSTGIENSNGGNGDWIQPVDSEEDWITYIVDILKKPNEKFPDIGLIETATWLVKHNDLELLEECYDAFQLVPIAEVRRRVPFFMSIIEKRGGEVIR